MNVFFHVRDNEHKNEFSKSRQMQCLVIYALKKKKKIKTRIKRNVICCVTFHIKIDFWSRCRQRYRDYPVSKFYMTLSMVKNSDEFFLFLLVRNIGHVLLLKYFEQVKKKGHQSFEAVVGSNLLILSLNTPLAAEPY